MKKSKLTLGIMASLVTVMSLVACSNNPQWGNDGNVLTLTNPDGTTTNITADDIMNQYTNEVSGTKTMFDTVYELIVRNYFTQESQKSNLADDKKKADADLSGLKDEANKKAKTNKTSYDEEFEKVLTENGVDSEAELKNKLEYKYMKSDFEDQFYKKYLNNDNRANNLRDGFKIGEKAYAGYLKEKIPYHVKHILVKVSAADGTFYNGEITQDEAIKLSKTVGLLTDSNYNFGGVAHQQSDDTGSRANYGDLGIMDKDTSYINEFKLGLYTYDALYNKETIANKDRIDIPTEEADFLDNNIIGQIPYGVFEELGKVADVEKDSDKNVVNKGVAFYYPRNVYFNKYLNSHAVSVIVPNDLPTADQLYQPDPVTGKASGDESYVGTRNDTYASNSRFVSKKDSFTNNISWTNNNDGKVLCDEKGRVILVVRGGTTSGSSYQGLHFIVVERSALKDIETIVTSATGSYDVSLSDYYTTHYPTEEKYPTYTYNGKTYDKNTYVNMFDLDTKGLKARAQTIEEKIKGYEPLLNTYIYQIFSTEQAIKFHGNEGTKVETAINNYIATQRTKQAYDSEYNWDLTWQNYMEYLEQQANERTKDKLLSATCAIQYQDATVREGNVGWNKGGMCGYDSGK